MNGLFFYFLGIGGIYAWGIYRIVKIFHYENHKYDKAYIQAKYHEGLSRCRDQVQQYTKKRSAHALKMTLFFIRIKRWNDAWHRIIRKIIYRWQFQYTNHFERQFNSDMAKIEKLAQSYQIYVGPQYREFLDGTP